MVETRVDLKIDLSTMGAVLINMEDRGDRLRDSYDELDRVLGRSPESVELIRPKSFDDAAGFINTGYRSCLDAHLRSAELALEQSWDQVLVLEDDIQFTDAWYEHGPQMMSELQSRHWDIAVLSLGWEVVTGVVSATSLEEPRWLANVDNSIGSQAYIVRSAALPYWIEHLRTIAVGEPGNRIVGPMGPDGALTTFIWTHADMTRLNACPTLVDQRRSRSDINGSRLDSVGALRPAVGAARKAKQKLNQLRS